jgi:phosphonate degradation associated HDIG domain protein
VTQLQHALQTAHLAEQAGADDELVTAALLHDIGHLLNDHGASPTLQGIDDVHQYVALPFLRGVFSDRVLGAVQRHVDAKRYLCAARPGYHEALSADSKRSLVLQGGTFSPDAAQRFIDGHGAEDAVRVRLWDDRAKSPELETPPLSHFLARAKRCMLARA